MSFSSMSVKEAIDKINATNNGWFLPAVQRPYVWGSRYESEKYICKLFDSILRGYPIGTLIVWNSEKEIPYRRFMNDFSDGESASFVDKNLWAREDKWLVYDGQQRLQTLYSCLKYTFNNKILVYNLFFDLEDNDDTEACGFEFVKMNSKLKAGYIAMNQLFIQPEDGKVKYRNETRKLISEEMLLGKEEKYENIIDRLWDVFIRTDIKSLAYFPIDKSWNEDRVNDVFQRLNMGGVPLSGADLLLSRIKEKNYDYEEKLLLETKKIVDITQGYFLEPNTILQIVHLLVKGTSRIDPDRIKEHELSSFIEVFNKLTTPLENFFCHFIWGQFRINNKSIINRGLALFPLLVYVFNRHQKGTAFLKIEDGNILKMKKYFILSQINDWNTQTIVHKCSQLANETAKDFPLDEMITFAGANNRLTEILVANFEEYLWFPLKILIPHRSYISASAVQGRYKPELDHIFPTGLENKPSDYNVNVLWNMQPVTGLINASKGNQHPKEFFSTPENKKYLDLYDFVEKDLKDPVWSDHKVFIEIRKSKMIEFMEKTYGLIMK